MKTNVLKKLCRYLPVLFPFFCSTQKAYVDVNAGGANDGSNWANAYTDLSAALTQSDADTLWIAQGTYKPGSGAININAFFDVNRPMVLLGGFAGNETTPDQRQPDLHPTVLSGDLMGDDVDWDFLNNKADNARLVLRVQANEHDMPTVLDGLVIAYGHRPQSIPGLLYPGGLWALSRVHIRHCSFRQNLADGGAAVDISGLGTAYSEISNCLFEGNKGNFFGIVAISSSEHISLRNISMKLNEAFNGMLYLGGIFDVTLEDSEFSNNTNMGQGGGGLYLSSVAPIAIRRCQFSQNLGREGSAVYMTNQSSPVFEDCTFTGNIARFMPLPQTGQGGAVYAREVSSQMKRCTFIGNEADGRAGAIFAENSPFTIDSCRFEANLALEGGAILLAEEETATRISNSSFIDNAALSHGGAISSRQRSSLDLSHCTFFNNAADSLGGAIRTVGAILVVDRCTFETNTARMGGAVSATGAGDFAGSMGISHTRFSANEAERNGGAIYVQDVDAYLTNCLLFSNVASWGGGIATSHQTSMSEIALVNCTVANNIVGIASSASEDVQASLLMLNTAMFNFGPNYEVFGNNPVQWSSLGGNLITDNSLPGFNQPGDQVGMSLDPLFISNSDYRPAPGSPLIDAGLPGNAPADDITGQLRDGHPDIGAYEAILTSVGEPAATTALGLYPNPASGNVWLQLPPDWAGQPVTITLYGPDGRHIRQEITGAAEWRLTLPHWPAGSYAVWARCGRAQRAGVVVMTAP